MGRPVEGGPARPVYITNDTLPGQGSGSNTIGKVDQGAPAAVANAWPVLEASRAASSSDVHAPVANTAAVVTYTAGGAGVYHVIGGIAWSYSGVPTNGNLKIEDDGVIVFTLDIVAAGPGLILFPRPKKNAVANKALVVTLSTGGAGITGKLNVTSHWTES